MYSIVQQSKIWNVAYEGDRGSECKHVLVFEVINETGDVSKAGN